MTSPSSESLRAEAIEAIQRSRVFAAADPLGNHDSHAADAVFAVLQKHIEAMETPYRRNIPIGCPHPVYGFAGTIPDAQYVTPTIYTAEAFKADVLALFGQEHGPETEETP